MFPSPRRNRSRRREQQLTKSMQMVAQQQQQEPSFANFDAAFGGFDNRSSRPSNNNSSSTGTNNSRSKDNDDSSVSSLRRLGFARYSEKDTKKSSRSLTRTREHAKQIALALSGSTPTNNNSNNNKNNSSNNSSNTNTNNMFFNDNDDNNNNKKSNNNNMTSSAFDADFGSAFSSNSDLDNDDFFNNNNNNSNSNTLTTTTTKNINENSITNKDYQQKNGININSNNNLDFFNNNNNNNNQRNISMKSDMTTATMNSTSNNIDVFSDPGIDWPEVPATPEPTTVRKASSTASGITKRRKSGSHNNNNSNTIIMTTPATTTPAARRRVRNSYSSTASSIQQQEIQQTGSFHSPTPSNYQQHQQRTPSSRRLNYGAVAPSSTKSVVRKISSSQNSVTSSSVISHNSTRISNTLFPTTTPSNYNINNNKFSSNNSTHSRSMSRNHDNKSNNNNDDLFADFNQISNKTTSNQKQKQPQHRHQSSEMSNSDWEMGGGGVIPKKSSGFSFDAFGLDGDEINREVSEAIHDLGWNTHRWDNETSSNNSTTNNSMTEHSTGSFVDGFKITAQSPIKHHHMIQHNQQQQTQYSPTRSEKSSLTSDSFDNATNSNNNNVIKVNMFKQQAGFSQTTRPRKVVRPQDTRVKRTMPQIPSLEPKQQQQQQQQKSMSKPPNVEFYDEDASSSANSDTDAIKSDYNIPSDVGVSSEVAGNSDIGQLPFSEIASKLHSSNQHQKTPSVRTESTAATTTAHEEKKDDVEMLNNNNQDNSNNSSNNNTIKSFGSLRSKWETRNMISAKEQERQRLLKQQKNVPSALSKEHIAKLQYELGDELLSPEKIMNKSNHNFACTEEEEKTTTNSQDRNKEQQVKAQHDEEEQQHDDQVHHDNEHGTEQQNVASLNKSEPQKKQQQQQQRIITKNNERSAECIDQRTSFHSMRERLKSPTNNKDINNRPKSEGGATFRKNNATSVNTIMANMEQQQRKESLSDSKSDSAGNTTPLYGVKLRKTGLSVTPPASATSSNNNSPNKVIQSGSGGGGFESQAAKFLRQQQSGQHILSPTKQKQQSQQWNNQQKNEIMLQQSIPESPAKTVRTSKSDLEQDPADAPEVQSVSSSSQSSNKLNYRARRELEIKKQQEEENRAHAEHKNEHTQQRDVASLIKQRIAANKKNGLTRGASPASTPGSQVKEAFASYRDHLKPVASDISQSPEMPASSQQQQDDDVVASNSSLVRRPDTDTSPDEIMPLPQNRNRSSAAPSFRSTDEPEEPVYSPSKVSPSKASLRISDNNDPDIVFETESPEKKRQNEEKTIASSAVSHLLMLQQIQQQGNLGESTDESPTGQADMSKIATQLSPRSANSEDHQLKTPKATKMMLNAFLAGRESISSKDGHAVAIQSLSNDSEDTGKSRSQPLSPQSGLPPLKDDPKYARYFKMLSVGMPMEVVKHAMTRDGLDPSVMDGDHNKPAGIPLKDDPKYAKYFRMLKIGLPMEAVKHAMERDGLDSAVMDQDHDLPAVSGRGSRQEEPKEKDSHRRARLHWKTLRKVTSNSLWAKIDQDDGLKIEIDEQEFQQLFQAEKNEKTAMEATSPSKHKRASTVCVIDPKRANNGGIILARLKMSHDDMADAVERIDEYALTSEQIENIIEYLPTKEERKALETYMLEGGQDAAEKFDNLCECEKFMVSMMTVKHAKRKVSALLFKLQFETCMRDIEKEAGLIENACQELISSVRLRQLLGIILNFGNRLNTAGNGKRRAGAFSLDSLLKLNQAKAFDKKTTFLHYIILIVRRNNKDLLDFKEDLPTVFQSEKVFWDQCVSDLEEVENQLENVRKIALYQAHQVKGFKIRRRQKREDPDESLSDAEENLSLEEEVEALRATPIGLFTLGAIKFVSSLRDKIEATKKKFARLLEYFGEEEGQMQPHELFEIIVTFSRDFEKAKDQVEESERRKQRDQRKRQPRDKGGKPPAHSPGLTEKRAFYNQKVSNMQPTLSGVLKDLRGSPAYPNKPTPNSKESPGHGYTSQPKVALDISPVKTPNKIQTVQAAQSFQSESSSPVNSKSPTTQPSTSVDSTSPKSQSSQLHPGRTARRPSTSSMTMTAMRAKARMHRSRDAASVSSQSTNTQEVSASNNQNMQRLEQAPLSPRSNMRMKRRQDQRQRVRRSEDATNALSSA